MNKVKSKSFKLRKFINGNDSTSAKISILDNINIITQDLIYKGLIYVSKRRFLRRNKDSQKKFLVVTDTKKIQTSINNLSNYQGLYPTKEIELSASYEEFTSFIFNLLLVDEDYRKKFIAETLYISSENVDNYINRYLDMTQLNNYDRVNDYVLLKMFINIFYRDDVDNIAHSTFDKLFEFIENATNNSDIDSLILELLFNLTLSSSLNKDYIVNCLCKLNFKMTSYNLNCYYRILINLSESISFDSLNQLIQKYIPNNIFNLVEDGNFYYFIKLLRIHSIDQHGVYHDEIHNQLKTIYKVHENNAVIANEYAISLFNICKYKIDCDVNSVIREVRRIKHITPDAKDINKILNILNTIIQ